MKVFIGADHRGYELKEKIKSHLQSDYDIEDCGALVHNPNDDYTTFASRVATNVAETPGTRGIIMCGSGVGVDIVANKFDGVRASIGKSIEQVTAGRIDDNFNILVIAADYTTEDEADDMIRAFLETEYEPNERRERRLKDIEEIEKIN